MTYDFPGGATYGSEDIDQYVSTPERSITLSVSVGFAFSLNYQIITHISCLLFSFLLS